MQFRVRHHRASKGSSTPAFEGAFSISDDQFNIQTNFTKAYGGEANVAHIEGLASSPEVDLTGERMALCPSLTSTVESFNAVKLSRSRTYASNDEIARRHMTDAQKVRLGQDIELDIAAVAKARGLANLRQGNKPPEVDTCPPRDKTRDEVARTAGIGSGRTYERGKEILGLLRNEPDAEQLIQHVDDGIDPRAKQAMS